MSLKLLPVVAVWALLSIAIPASAEMRVALVIGNSNYEHANALTNPKNDAHDIAAKLTALGFDVVHGVDLTVQSFNYKLREFAGKLRRADVALLFYAGHGVAVGGINYLVPVDAQLDSEGDLEIEAVSLATIQRIMESRPRTNILIFDACRNNPFTRSISRSLGKNRSSLVRSGWASVDPATGTYISFATKPGDVASDGEGRNSPFTKALLSHIDTPGVDIEVMMKQVRKDVIAATRANGKTQTPWARTSMVSNFVFGHQTQSLARQLTGDFITSDKTSYKQGDKIKLYITPPKDCRLTLLNLDKTGQSCQQFPHPALQDNVLKAGQRFVFPPKGSLTLAEAGEETFVAMCNASDEAKAAATRNTRSAGCSKGASDRTFNQKTLELAIFDPNDKGGTSSSGTTPTAKKQTVLRSSLTVKVEPK